jgi:hypothetical protein
MGLTLREGDREYFYAALDRFFPGMKNRYIRTYGNAYEVSSPNRARLMNLFEAFCEKNGIIRRPEKCFDYLNAFPEQFRQMSLLD